jgi:P-type Cu+ transporter
VHITVKGGYSPDLIRVRQKVPLRIVFDRQERGDCTSRVVFPDFAVNDALPAYAKTTVELTPFARRPLSDGGNPTRTLS